MLLLRRAGARAGARAMVIVETVKRSSARLSSGLKVEG